MTEQPLSAVGDYERSVGKLVDELQRALFVFRLARAHVLSLERKFPGLTELDREPQRSQYVSARTRMRQSAFEIDAIVSKYVQEGEE